MVGILFILTSLALKISASSQNTCQIEWALILNSSIPDSNNYYSMKTFSGFTKNNLGDYESCLSLEQSKYVLIKFIKSPMNVQSFCGPESCTVDDYLNMKNLGLNLISNDKYEVYFPEEIQKENYEKIYPGGAAMIMFILFIVFLCIISTLIEFLCEKFGEGQNLEIILLCCSLKKNSLALLANPHLAGISLRTGFLQANKVLSLFWIILAHTFQYKYFYPALNNLDEAFETTKNGFYGFVYGAFYAVDAFFWAVGFAFSIHCLEKLKHSKEISAKSIFFELLMNRYFQLTSTYLFCLFFFWTLEVFVGSGPLWIDLEKSCSDCESYWLTNLVYLNTFIPGFKGNNCLAAGWYIANDIQFLAVVLVVSIVFFKYGEKLALSLLAGLTVASLVSCFIVAYTMNLTSFFSADSAQDFYQFYYIKPYCRIAPCLFGVFSGFVYFTFEEYKEDSKAQPLLEGKKNTNSLCEFVAWVFLHRIIGALSLLIGIVGFILLLIINFDNYDNPGQGDLYLHWTSTELLTFYTLEKFAIGLILSLIYIPISFNHFPILTNALSSYPFVILARFNFCAFLIHNNLIEIWYKSQKNIETFGMYENLLDSILLYFLCVLFAVPMVMFIEMPVVNLFQLYIHRKNK